MPDTKTCTRCLETKHLDAFNKHIRMRDGLSTRCRTCTSELHKVWLENNREHVEAYHREYREKNRGRRSRASKEWTLKRKYGLTPEDYTAIFEGQDGVCAICKKPPKGDTGHERLATDHSHSTGTVRGLLCLSCNTKLGVLENTEWRTLAEAYLAERG